MNGLRDIYIRVYGDDFASFVFQMRFSFFKLQISLVGTGYNPGLVFMLVAGFCACLNFGA